MNDADRTLLHDLFTNQRVLALAVVIDGKPAIGLLPFAIRQDFSAVLVHASSMARHTQGMQARAPFSALIHAADLPGAEPLQLPRVSIEGEVHVFERNSPAYFAGREIFLKRFPEAEVTFKLGDFNLYELRFRSARLVGGFARASNVPLDTLRQLAT
jgi:heme iron utilization protein